MNASKQRWEIGIQDLQERMSQWPDIMQQIIAQKTPYQHFQDVIFKHPVNEIKSVILWDSSS